MKSISFTRFYWGLVKHEDRFTERHNQRIREKEAKSTPMIVMRLTTIVAMDIGLRLI